MVENSGRTASWKWAPIFTIALAIPERIVVVTWQYLEMNRSEIVREALSAGEIGARENPWRLPRDLSAHCMPAYPRCWAGVFWLFGKGSRRRSRSG